jgi:methionyl-tRNA formyltransferase
LIVDGHEIAAVFTQPDKPAGRGKQLHAPPVKAFALEHRITIYQPSRIKTNDEVRYAFEAISPDACIVVLAIPRFGCINVHASLLPKYRGAAPINWVIANGEQETGVTIMQMDAGMDTGPMFAKRSTPIGSDETAPQLSERLAQIGAELLSDTLPGIERGDVLPIPQDDSQASYAPILKREVGSIDWGLTAREIANRVRAFQPWPGSHTRFRGGKLTIWRAVDATATASNTIDSEPGTILKIDESGIALACSGPSSLLVTEIQIEGKRRVSARDFANGARLNPGDQINEN